MMFGYGFPEMLITVVWGLLALLLGIGFPAVVIVFLSLIYKKVKSIEEQLKQEK
jgi:hypothetical protein